MSLVFPSRHPLVQHHTAALRDASTTPPEFRRLVRILASMLAQEATADLKSSQAEVMTPLASCPVNKVSEIIGIVPILRAGLGMVDGILELIPHAEIWHVGLYRDEQTLKPMEYYRRLPSNSKISVALLVDPMLATGGSALHACQILKEVGITRIKLISLIAAPEGIKLLSDAMPDVAIHVGAVDDHLNEHGYIVPGLGDAGDRQFATSH
ncbi:uracil phosphoribosyltransferase [Singulisphaera sp. PoT]|uniref:uracil phosphoribosyltransferase n=1 Tax=Singulisphaera sp. PoT TaxID=3411797 RepID=UPI003BF595BE